MNIVIVDYMKLIFEELCVNNVEKFFLKFFVIVVLVR